MVNLIAVTTCNLHNNPKINEDLEITIKSIRDNSISDIFIVDDGSPKDYQDFVTSVAQKYGCAYFLIKCNIGISGAKNACIKRFLQGKYDLLFLLDDDIEILSDKFELGYSNRIRNGLEILSFYDPQYTGEIAQRDGDYLMSQSACGACIVITRKCIEQVGLYASMPQKWGYEHIEYWRRCFSRGFTKSRNSVDIHDSDKFVRIRSNESVISDLDKIEFQKQNYEAMILLENQRTLNLGGTYYNGLFCQQVANFDIAMSAFLLEQNFTDIVEIGTGYGGFTSFLRDVLPYAKINSWDIERRFDIGLINDVNFHKSDIFNDDKLINAIRFSDKLLVICDGGNKPKEVDFVSRIIKSGDIIASHDYCESLASFHANYSNKIWNWCEITNSDIPKSLIKVNNLDNIMWGVWINE